MWAATSVPAHLLLWFVLGFMQAPPPPRPPPVEVELVERVILPPEPEVEPEIEPEPKVEPETEPVIEPEPVVEPSPRPRPRARAPEPSEEPEPPAPAEETPFDFSGETLSNDSAEPSWQSAVGNGGAMNGPVGAAGAQVTGRVRHGQRDGQVGGQGQGPATSAPLDVAPSNLSRQPGPPASRLRRLLENNYPERARDLSIDGVALVRIRVLANGRVQPLAVLSESYAGFGQACRRTLRQGGRWSPPLDRNGQPVSTVMPFQCTFTVSF